MVHSTPDVVYLSGGTHPPPIKQKIFGCILICFMHQTLFSFHLSRVPFPLSCSPFQITEYYPPLKIKPKSQLYPKMYLHPRNKLPRYKRFLAPSGRQVPIRKHSRSSAGSGWVSSERVSRARNTPVVTGHSTSGLVLWKRKGKVSGGRWSSSRVIFLGEFHWLSAE